MFMLCVVLWKALVVIIDLTVCATTRSSLLMQPTTSQKTSILRKQKLIGMERYWYFCKLPKPRRFSKHAGSANGG